MLENAQLIYVANLALHLYVQRPRTVPSEAAAHAVEIVVLAAIAKPTRVQKDKLHALAELYEAEVLRGKAARDAKVSLLFYKIGYRDSAGCDTLQVA